MRCILFATVERRLRDGALSGLRGTCWVARFPCPDAPLQFRDAGIETVGGGQRREWPPEVEALGVGRADAGKVFESADRACAIDLLLDRLGRVDGIAKV